MREEEAALVLVLIANKDDVTIPAGVLAQLCSYALAGPAFEQSVALRDEAVSRARQAMIDTFERLYPVFACEYGCRERYPVHDIERRCNKHDRRMYQSNEERP